LFGGGYEVWLKLTKVCQSNFRQGPSPEFLSWVNKFGIIIKSFYICYMDLLKHNTIWFLDFTNKEYPKGIKHIKFMCEESILFGRDELVVRVDIDWVGDLNDETYYSLMKNIKTFRIRYSKTGQTKDERLLETKKMISNLSLFVKNIPHHFEVYVKRERFTVDGDVQN
jgi:hypothetical protein